MATFSSDRAIYEDFVKCNNTVYDEKAIKNSIKNILLTPIGTMPGKPEFGSRLLEIPFSQNDFATTVLLSRVIFEALSRWETRIVFTGATFNINKNKLEAVVTYYYKNSSFKDSLSLEFLELQ